MQIKKKLQFKQTIKIKNQVDIKRNKLFLFS